MKKLSILALLFFSQLILVSGHNRIFCPEVKTLQAFVGKNWLSPPVLRLESDDILHVSFDELSHQYRRYTYRVEHCEADWQPSAELFESDFLEGFNGLPIDDYSLSTNTTFPYTHYELDIPNSQCRLKLSGNYRLYIYDEEKEEEVAVVEFFVAEEAMTIGAEITTNTDIDLNATHQQLSLQLNYGDCRVTAPDEQIQLVILQNGYKHHAVHSPAPTQQTAKGLTWQHCRDLIFDGGNIHHKYEVLDVSHTTMGIDKIRWDGSAYQVWPYTDLPRVNYIYDEAAKGYFYIRNSDNWENATTCDYVWVNYRLQMPPLNEGTVRIDGHWTTDADSNSYLMSYEPSTGCYQARLLQKQGYYTYRYQWQHADGSVTLLPADGNFYQTENAYQVIVYFREQGDRTWRLTAYRQFDF